MNSWRFYDFLRESDVAASTQSSTQSLPGVLSCVHYVDNYQKYFLQAILEFDFVVGQGEPFSSPACWVLVSGVTFYLSAMGKRKVRSFYSKRSRRKTSTFRGNQHSDARLETDLSIDVEEEADDETPVDSSFLKLHGFPFADSLSDDSGPSDDDDEEDEVEDDGDSDTVPDGNRIVNLPALQELLSSSCLCSRCKKGTLNLSEQGRHGLAPTSVLSCSNCKHLKSSTVGQRQIRGKSRFYDINRRAVLAMRILGCGCRALRTLCSILDMPSPMSNRTFECHRKAVHTASKNVCETSMKRAANAVLVRRQGEDQPDEIAVSTDGTWMRRGHSSLYGVQTVISYDTSQVLDVEVLSKACAECSSWKAKVESGSVTRQRFAEWEAGHQESCHINTTVSAPAMETEAVVRLWNRSIEQRGLKYVTYIGDGDSKGHKTVANAKPYGDTPIVKDECIGHVQKRLGKAFRELKKKQGSSKLSDGKPLCGKERLTEKYMDRLQNYYGRAIRDNVSDLQGMAKAIWASVCHRTSTDAKPRHEYCPPGETSWCKWQQQKAGAQVVVEHKDPLPEAVFLAIKPIVHNLDSNFSFYEKWRSCASSVMKSAVTYISCTGSWLSEFCFWLRCECISWDFSHFYAS